MYRKPSIFEAMSLKRFSSGGLAAFFVLAQTLECANAYPTPTPTPTPSHRITPTPTPSPIASRHTPLTPTPTPTPTPSGPPAMATTPLGSKPIKLKDVDGRTFTINRKGRVCVVFGTDSDSQDLARKAGVAMYPFQGRRDFQMTVIVDLGGSIATWVPNLAVSKMRENLDTEATELKPFYEKNKNFKIDALVSVLGLAEAVRE